MLSPHWGSRFSADAKPTIDSTAPVMISVVAMRLERSVNGPTRVAPKPTSSPMITMTMATSMIVNPFWFMVGKRDPLAALPVDA